MAKYLFDTDIIIDYLNKKDSAEKVILSLTENDHIYISVITLSELQVGWDTKQKNVYLPKIKDIAKQKRVDEKIALYAGELIRLYKQKGKILHLHDMIIAATAILNECILVTRNTRDFPIPELNLYK